MYERMYPICVWKFHSRIQERDNKVNHRGRKSVTAVTNNVEVTETSGAWRIKAQLNKENIPSGKNNVSSLMNENNIYSGLKRKFKVTTYYDHEYPVASNLLNQDFSTKKPNEKWVGDITYTVTKETDCTLYT